MSSELPQVLHSPLSPDEALRTLVECFSGPGSMLGAMFKANLGGGGRRPSNMTGWGWSRVSGPDTNGQHVFRVTRAPGLGSVKGLTLACQVTPAASGGSAVRIDRGADDSVGRTLPGVVGSAIEKEIALLRDQLRAS